MTEVDILLAGGGLLAGAIAFFFLFGGRNPVIGAQKRHFQLNSRTRMASRVRKQLRGKRRQRPTETAE